jgi:hypothetical protein
MIGKFPDVKADTDNHRKLGVNTGKIPGNDRVEGSHDSELAAVLLGKITKSKQLYFHRRSIIKITAFRAYAA